jgi:hypothetical protein
MMGIEKIDKNFATKTVKSEEYDWFDYTNPNVSLHGLFYDSEDKYFKRMPTSVAKDTSDGVLELHNNTAGGRLRFRTNSLDIAIKVKQSFCGIMPHMPFFGQMGVAVYVDGIYGNTISARYVDVADMQDQIITYDGLYSLNTRFRNKEIHDIELYFPLYYNVKELYVGVKKGTQVIKPNDYTYTTPIVYYGSSITQGGCAGHPGNDYQGFISRMFDTDYINLGFSGSAKAEPAMVEYVTDLNPSIFVLDYDHNAPTLEHLRKTHFPFYQRFREKHPDTPIIFMSKPDVEYRDYGHDYYKIVKSSYLKAKRLGDKNVYFISGYKLFGKDQRDACTVDGCHPNDLGFYRMACALRPVIAKLLRK